MTGANISIQKFAGCSTEYEKAGEKQSKSPLEMKGDESPLEWKEIKPVNPKGNQPWVFIGRTNAEAEAPIFCPPDAKTDSLEKTLMLEKIEGRRRMGQQRMRWLDGIIDLMNMNLSELQELVIKSNHLVLCRPLFLLLSIFPSNRSFQMSQLFTSGGLSIGASASVLLMYIQDWFPLGWTGWISLKSKGLSRVFSNTKFKSINSSANKRDKF